jgi:hypothetical protein
MKCEYEEDTYDVMDVEIAEDVSSNYKPCFK